MKNRLKILGAIILLLVVGIMIGMCLRTPHFRELTVSIYDTNYPTEYRRYKVTDEAISGEMLIEDYLLTLSNSTPKTEVEVPKEKPTYLVNLISSRIGGLLSHDIFVFNDQEVMVRINEDEYVMISDEGRQLLQNVIETVETLEEN